MVCYEYLLQVPVPCWSQIIASVRGSIQRLMIHEREVIYDLGEICRQYYDFKAQSYVCILDYFATENYK